MNIKHWLLTIVIPLNLFAIVLLIVFPHPFNISLEILGILNLVLFSALIFGLMFRKRIQKNPVKTVKMLDYIGVGAAILSFILLETADIMEGKPLNITFFIWFFLYLIISILLSIYVIKKLKKQEREKQEQEKQEHIQ